MTNLKDYYGITITNIFDDKLEDKFIKALQSAEKPIIARIVVDRLDDYTPYIAAFKMASRYCKPMLQICDSYLDGMLTDDEYNARELWMLENLSEYAPFVEIGNEVGSANNWSSKNQVARVKKSADLWVGHERILTYFWPGNINDYANVSFEHLAASFYPHKLEDFATLPKDIILSECGMEEWEGHYGPKIKELVRRKAYSIGAPCFWWDWQTECAP